MKMGGMKHLSEFALTGRVKGMKPHLDKRFFRYRECMIWRDYYILVVAGSFLIDPFDKVLSRETICQYQYILHLCPIWI
jgi:hypothetical protein